MRIALIADTYTPLKTSGAVQVRDLSIEFVNQGHEVTVFIASPEINEDWLIELNKGVRIVRLKSPKTKDINYFRRTVGELMMPYLMAFNLSKTPLACEQWDGVVWYSPSIFLAPLAKKLKRLSNCRSYLIIRDICPAWAVDLGLMGKGLPYKFFKAIANYQYSVADGIGVQTIGNVEYFRNTTSLRKFKVEVLHNWLAQEPISNCSINISNSKLAGRKIFIYAGNRGIAQGMDIMLNLAERFKCKSDVGFLFVGRGSDIERLRKAVLDRELNNIIFNDEVDPIEIPGLYSQCHIGLVALDPRHKTHNIPGKFLSYMRAGLPVLANINQGNDLVKLILDEGVGKVVVDNSLDSLETMALELLSKVQSNDEMNQRCRLLAWKLYSPKVAVKQILQALVL